MTDLEQLADEALDLRTETIRRAVRRMVGRAAAAELEHGDVEGLARIVATVDFHANHPGLDALAEKRKNALAELYEAGVTPDDGCTVRAILVQITAEPDPHLPHRYRIYRNSEQIGLAWLSTDDPFPGMYVVQTEGAATRGADLEEALQRMAQIIDRFERAAREGAIQ